MPNLAAHIDLARQAARRLADPKLDAHLGYYLLGSTSPDIRVITRRTREEYHFAPLDFDAIGAGVAGMFTSHPDLLPASGRDWPTQAFVAGYITHLTADEVWITDMFRPYFGHQKVFEDEAAGQMMDRALQLELDRQAWHAVDGTLDLLGAAADSVNIGFIPGATLDDWRQWVVGHLQNGFSWERLRFMARRIASGDESHPVHELAEDFIRTMPESLETLHEAVPRGDFESFKTHAVEELAVAVGEYLR